MALVVVERVINAPIDQVWASWDDFGSIYRFNPNLRGSRLLDGSTPTGLGARRQCDMSDGKNHLREEIIGYEPNRRLQIDIIEGSMPLKRARATFDFKIEGPEKTHVRMSMDFLPTMGVIGLMMIPIMKSKMRSMLQLLLDGNAAYVERGEEVLAA